jgi:hypothetical protein
MPPRIPRKDRRVLQGKRLDDIDEPPGVLMPAMNEDQPLLRGWRQPGAVEE